jgi:hypothetical protein
MAKGVFVKRNSKEVKPENREDKKIIKNRVLPRVESKSIVKFTSILVKV